MFTSVIKLFFVIVFLIVLIKDGYCSNFVITSERNISYSFPDSTKERGKKTTKTRVPKDKGRKQSEDEDSDEDDFWGNCFSTCLFNFFSGGNGETEEEIPEAEIKNEKENKKTEADEIKTEENSTAISAGFLGLNLNGDGFFGDITDEYKDPGVSLGIDGFAFYKKFALNLGVTYGYNSADPQFNYITNLSQNDKIVDIPDKSEIDYTYLSFGLNYIITDYKTLENFGFLIGAGINYIIINEETELIRETYRQDTLISSVNTFEKITRSSVSPMISAAYIGSFSTKLRFNVNLCYTFIKLDPQKKLSTPFDWNEVNGQLKIGFGLWYKIF